MRHLNKGEQRKAKENIGKQSQRLLKSLRTFESREKD